MSEDLLISAVINNPITCVKQNKEPRRNLLEVFQGRQGRGKMCKEKTRDEPQNHYQSFLGTGEYDKIKRRI